jgi:toxin ParE1/3/4
VRRRRVAIRPAADRDLDDHYDYLAGDSLDAAMRLLEAARAAFDELLQMPGIGRPRLLQNPRLAGLRQWAIRGFPSYLIFYRGTDEGIEVVRVLHGARDIERILEDEGNE